MQITGGSVDGKRRMVGISSLILLICFDSYLGVVVDLD